MTSSLPTAPSPVVAAGVSASHLASGTLLLLLSLALLAQPTGGPVFRKGSPLPHPHSGRLHPKPYQCNPSEVVQQMHRLTTYQSACPGNEWWPLLYSAGLACRDLTLVDVGANKGYVLSTWMEMLRPQSGISPAAMHRRFGEKYNGFGENMGGACEDFLDAPIKPVTSRICSSRTAGGGGAAAAPGASSGASPPGAVVEADSFSVTLHAFEPVTGNVKILTQVLEPWVATSPLATLHIHQTAVVGDPTLTTVEFGACIAGSEKCGVRTGDDTPEGDSSWSKGGVVPATTLDAWVAEEGLGVIDVLAIDAEGMDPEVLRGAQGLLGRGGVRILQFEYHMMRAWGKAKLEDVVASLDSQGYDCFFLQKHRAVVRITGCWHKNMEAHAWMNVMCVQRSEPALLAVLQGMMVSVTGQDKPQGEGEVAVGVE